MNMSLRLGFAGCYADERKEDSNREHGDEKPSQLNLRSWDRYCADEVCSRNCSGQSTPEPSRTAAFNIIAATHSIETS
jgi:hypothetical protein